MMNPKKVSKSAHCSSATPGEMDKSKIKSYLLDLQNHITNFLEAEDGHSRFNEESWMHQEGGGGLSRVLTGEHVLERAGVNFSHVLGARLPPTATVKRPELAEATFQALGVSVVIHPYNPYIPTAHMNVRFIQVDKKNAPNSWWFGGGFDLTPYYGFVEDCRHWHQMAKEACQPFGEALYPRYKQWCDEYFFLKHRNEPRGIGGIFFDDVNDNGFDRCFAFMQAVGNGFINAYVPIIARRKHHSFGKRERDFQLYRRGRYVEFNLLYDRGTLFGLQSGGRTESILVSLPPLVRFSSAYPLQEGTPEAKLYTEFLVHKDWA